VVFNACGFFINLVIYVNPKKHRQVFNQIASGIFKAEKVGKKMKVVYKKP
jgi:hypothetical protein